MSKEEEFYYCSLVPGSLVWAQQTGYPWYRYTHYMLTQAHTHTDIHTHTHFTNNTCVTLHEPYLYLINTYSYRHDHISSEQVILLCICGVCRWPAMIERDPGGNDFLRFKTRRDPFPVRKHHQPEWAFKTSKSYWVNSQASMSGLK